MLKQIEFAQPYWFLLLLLIIPLVGWQLWKKYKIQPPMLVTTVSPFVTGGKTPLQTKQGNRPSFRDQEGRRVFNLMQACFQEGNPSGIKAVLSVQGKIHNRLRLPNVPVTAALYEKIEQLVKL